MVATPLRRNIIGVFADITQSMTKFDKKVTVLDGEVVEPLDGSNGIIQPINGYRFGADAVSLAKFACEYVKRGDAVFDLCSGCGIVGILIAIERGATVRGAEIDEALCDMSNRSSALDGLGSEFYNVDIRDVDKLTELAGKKRYDAVTVNPPFFKADCKPCAAAPQAGSEVTVTFAEVAAAAKILLKDRGEFFVVHTATRLDEILYICRDNKLTPKNLIVNRNGKTFLLRCVLGAKDGLAVTVKG